MSDRILTIARREFRSYFDHATAYVVLVVFLAVNSFFFFRSLFTSGLATLRPMFDLFPWLFLFFVPAVTMGAIARERSSGTLEMTLSQPVRSAEFLVGKYLGVMGLVGVALLATLGAPLGVSVGGDVRWGVVFAQYVGSALLAGGLVAIGLWASSTTENQITAFILAVAVIFVFVGMNLRVVRVGLPPVLAAAADRLGVLTHFRNITRGVLDLRDVVYFVTLGAGFLSLAYWSLLREKLSRRRSGYRTLRLGTLGLLGIFVMVNLLGRRIRGRWDLTPGDVYTISGPTRDVLAGLDDVVTVKFFVSEELPAQVSHVKRDVVDVLRDYQAIVGDDFRVERIDPRGSESARREAREARVPPIQFNALGEGQMEVQEGYMGLSIQYADGSEQIPVIRRSQNLEYRLTTAIRALTSESRPTVGFLTGHGEKSLGRDLGRVREDLADNYRVRRVNLSPGEGAPRGRPRMPPGVRSRMPPGAPMGGRGGPSPSAGGAGQESSGPPLQAGPSDTAADTTSEPARVPSDLDALIVAGPQRPLSADHVRALRRYLEDGGSVMLMLEGMRQPKGPRGPAVPTPPSRLDSLLATRGVGVVSGYALDLRSNQQVGLTGSGGVRYSRPYPLWLVSRPASDSPLVRDLNGVLLPWASPIETRASADSAAVQPLLRTTRFGGRVTGSTSIRPQRDWKTAADSLRRQTLAVALDPGAGGIGARGADGPAPADSAGPGRVVLVGDADFVTNRFVQGSEGNLDFFRNAVDWLAREEALIELRGGQRSPPRLVFESDAARSAVKWANTAGVPLLFVLLGGWRLLRRRRVQRRRYRPPEDSP